MFGFGRKRKKAEAAGLRTLVFGEAPKRSDSTTPVAEESPPRNTAEPRKSAEHAKPAAPQRAVPERSKKADEQAPIPTAISQPRGRVRRSEPASVSAPTEGRVKSKDKSQSKPATSDRTVGAEQSVAQAKPKAPPKTATASAAQQPVKASDSRPTPKPAKTPEPKDKAEAGKKNAAKDELKASQSHVAERSAAPAAQPAVETQKEPELTDPPSDEVAEVIDNTIDPYGLLPQAIQGDAVDMSDLTGSIFPAWKHGAAAILMEACLENGVLIASVDIYKQSKNTCEPIDGWSLDFFPGEPYEVFVRRAAKEALTFLAALPKDGRGALLVWPILAKLKD